MLALGLPCPETIQVRLVKVTLPNGQSKCWPPRWWTPSATGPIRSRRCTPGAGQSREAFKTIKHRLHIEGWSGELPQAIEQDVVAKILMHNITEALCEKAQQALPADICNTSRVNHAYALTHLHALIVAWIGSNADALHRCWTQRSRSSGAHATRRSDQAGALSESIGLAGRSGPGRLIDDA